MCPAQKGDCPKTLDAGMAQLTVGLAWHYKKYANEQDPQQRGQYAFAEEEARAKRAGLWKRPESGAGPGLARRESVRATGIAAWLTRHGVFRSARASPRFCLKAPRTVRTAPRSQIPRRPLR